MKKAVIAVGCALLFCQGAAASPIVSFNPREPIVTPGTIFPMEVNVENVDDLFAFDISIAFDPSILALLGVSEGPFLPSQAPLGTLFFVVPTGDAGKLRFVDTILGPFPGADGTGVLARLSFDALRPGSTPLRFEAVLNNQHGAAIQTSFIPTEVTVVPEPASILLLGTGGAVLGTRLSLRRRRLK